MDTEERNSKMEQFSRAYSELKAKIDSLSPGELQFKPGPAKWSAHEIVVHIADAEANGYVRLRRALAEPGGNVMAYDQDVWASSLDYHSRDIAEHLELFRLLRKTSHEIMKKLPEEKWQNQYNHPEYGLVSLERFLTIYAGHITGHIAQIDRNLVAMKAEVIG